MPTVSISLDSKRWFDQVSGTYKTSGEMFAGYEADAYSASACSYRFLLPSDFAGATINSATLNLTVTSYDRTYSGADTEIGIADTATSFSSLPLDYGPNFPSLLGGQTIKDEWASGTRDHTVYSDTTTALNINVKSAIESAVSNGRIDNDGLNFVWRDNASGSNNDLLGDNNTSPTLTLDYTPGLPQHHSFETDADGWVGSGWFRTTTQAHHGSYSLFADYQDDNLYQTFTWNEPVTVSLWYRHDMSDCTATFVVQSETGAITYHSYELTQDTALTWHEYTIDISTGTYRLGVLIDDDDGNGEVWIDDINITAQSAVPDHIASGGITLGGSAEPRKWYLLEDYNDFVYDHDVLTKYPDSELSTQYAPYYGYHINVAKTDTLVPGKSAYCYGFNRSTYNDEDYYVQFPLTETYEIELSFQIKIVDTGMDSLIDSRRLLSFNKGDNTQIYIDLNYDGNGEILVMDGYDSLQTLSIINPLTLNEWKRVEMKLRIGYGDGTFRLTVDNVVVIDANNLDTRTNTDTIDNLRLHFNAGGIDGGFYIDEMYTRNSPVIYKPMSGGITLGGVSDIAVNTTVTIEGTGGIVGSGSGINGISRTIPMQGGLEASGEALMSLDALFIATGGLSLSGQSTVEIQPALSMSGGLGLSGESTVAIQPPLSMSGGLSLSGESTVEIQPALSMSGGLGLSGQSTYIKTVFNCMSLIKLNCPTSSTSDNQTGGVVLGSSTWHAITNRITTLKSYFPLGIEENTDLLNENPATSHGTIDITTGLFCEVAEKITSQRYYQISNIDYWDGFAVSMWYRSTKNLSEQSLFSINPSLRLGLSWNQEPTIYCQFDDNTTDQSWGSKLDTNWHHIVLNYNPGYEVAIYVDGNLSCKLSEAKQFLLPSYGTYIGYHDGGGYLQGDIQDFRVYNTPINAKGEYLAYQGMIEI